MNRRISFVLIAFSFLPIVCPSSSPVVDAVTGQPAAGFHWRFPWTYLLFAPFCSAADWLTVLSMKEMMVFLGHGIITCLWFPRRKRMKGAAILLFLIFLGWSALAPRPMARLVAGDPNCLLIDFHSHTSFSHDGRKSFTPTANRRWHERQGFGAAFITDHNLITGNGLVRDSSPYFSLSGEEVSLYNTHIGVLGNADFVNHSLYDSAYSQIPGFIDDMHRKNYLTVAHLPEYWREHWKYSNTDFLNWKVDGFEIVNSVPYCLDFPPALKRQIIAHCRQKNLFMTGVSDNHGWGSATAAWSAMQIPGWGAMSAETLESAVLDQLRHGGFQAVRVLERPRPALENPFELLISPWIRLWIGIRSLGTFCFISWIIWTWVVAVVCGRKRGVVAS